MTDGVASMVPGISERSSGVKRVLHLDQLGAARLQIDANQNITNQFNSDAFGIPTQIVNPNGSQAAFAAGWNYQSDPESGLQLLGHRYYDPGSWRFITRDPAGDGFNWYAYCGNEPMLLLDPEGLSAISDYAWDHSLGRPPSLPTGDAYDEYIAGNDVEWDYYHYIGKGKKRRRVEVRTRRYTDCGWFVSSCARQFDSQFPSSGKPTQLGYVRAHPDRWKLLKYQGAIAQEGDLLSTGHHTGVVIYGGHEANASLGDHPPYKQRRVGCSPWKYIFRPNTDGMVSHPG